MMEECLRIALCDTSAEDAKALSTLIEAAEFDTESSTFDSGLALLDSLNGKPYDFVFIDLQLEGESGIDVAVEIRKKDADVPIAFTTKRKSRELKARRFRSLHCIEKPMTEDAVVQCLALADTASKKLRKHKLSFLTDEEKKRDVAFKDILFIKAQGPGCLVYTERSEEPIATNPLSLSDIERQLPHPQFHRSHRDYIVNMQKVRGFADHDIVMDNGIHILVRISERTKIEAIYGDFVFSLTRD